MKTLNFVKAKVIPTMLPVNVRNITPKPARVPVMTIISNVMHKPGANKTAITQLLVPFRNMLMNNVRTDSLIINNARPIMTGLAVTPVILTLVLPGRNFIKIPDVVLMILLMELAARRQDARVIHLHLTLLTEQTVRTGANIPVIIPAI